MSQKNKKLYKFNFCENPYQFVCSFISSICTEQFAKFKGKTQNKPKLEFSEEKKHTDIDTYTNKILRGWQIL